ncbi:type II secretion system protein J [Bdellovibrio bacteriovorus]|uniref:PulJ/GspJ family protein n=1 Tax=Bdellovibrio bacteriovorus TaxID=959 RepID=UPI0035A5A37C
MMIIKNNRGLTLAEMIVGVALMGIMGMVAASFFVFTAKDQKRNHERDRRQGR